MSHTFVCEDVAQSKSINERSEVKKTSTISPVQGVGRNGHSRDNVNRNTVHAQSSLLMSRLPESSVLTKRDMQNMGLELRTAALIFNHWL